MRELLNLTGYEYKKIFQKRSTWIALGAVLLWVLFAGIGATLGEYYIEGEKVDSHYQMIKQERYALEHLEVQELNPEFFEKMQEDMAEFSETMEGISDNPKAKGNLIQYWKEYYKAYAPYSALYTLLAMMKNRIGDLDIEKIDGTNFYENRDRMMELLFQGEELSEQEIIFHEKENEKIKTPYAYGNMLGFDSYFQMQAPNFIFLAFAVAVILAPMFAGERTSRMDALVLSSRYGKNKLIQAKILTGLSFALFAALGFSIIFLLEIQAVYGLSGWNLPIQASMEGFYLNLPVNLLEFLGIGLQCGGFVYDSHDCDVLFRQNENAFWRDYYMLCIYICPDISGESGGGQPVFVHAGMQPAHVHVLCKKRGIPSSAVHWKSLFLLFPVGSGGIFLPDSRTGRLELPVF